MGAADGLSGPPRVLLACPGLDHARRGFETFARECFEALRDREDLRIELVKGSGAPGPGERTVPTLGRDSRVAVRAARARRIEPFVVEHVTFACALVPYLARARPDVVLFSEWHVGRVLSMWRRASRAHFALVFSNGALVPGGYGDLDRTLQLVPGALEYAVAAGESPERQEVLPPGVAIERALRIPSRDERAALRARLGLPAGRRIVLSAGAINRQKRMDVLIEAVASLPEPRPFLVLAGQQEADSPAIRALAVARLGPDGHDVRTVAQAGMPELYRAADAFVLASLWESFGRVLVEALAHGLPCLAHEHPVMRWVLGDVGDTADLTHPGALAAWLAGDRSGDRSETAMRRRHEAAYRRFSWAMLADRYAATLRAVAAERGDA